MLRAITVIAWLILRHSMHSKDLAYGRLWFGFPSIPLLFGTRKLKTHAQSTDGRWQANWSMDRLSYPSVELWIGVITINWISLLFFFGLKSYSFCLYFLEKEFPTKGAALSFITRRERRNGPKSPARFCFFFLPRSWFNLSPPRGGGAIRKIVYKGGPSNCVAGNRHCHDGHHLLSTVCPSVSLCIFHPEINWI